MEGKQFIKKATIEVVEVQKDGVLVQNTGKHADRWVIPKDVFENTYVAIEYRDKHIVEHHVDYQGPTNSHNFSEALNLLKEGHKLARKGWNGKDMFIYYVAANKYPMSNNLMETMAGRYEDDMVPYQAYIAFKTVDDTVVPWLASQTDMLAEDWRVVDDTNLCDTCTQEFATCKSKPTFGNGRGNDNVIECNGHTISLNTIVHINED